MNALLALSAAHLAWQTKNNDTEHLAYHHRGIALKGLHEALSTFSEQSSEAVLSASMLLSWQAKDWRSWVSLQQGISTVGIQKVNQMCVRLTVIQIMSAMRPWMHQSELAKFLESQRSLARIRTPSTPSISGLPPQTPMAEDLQRLEQMVTALHNLRLRLSSFPDLAEHIDEILEYVEQMQQNYPFQFPESAFEQLLQLRSTIFWLPTTILRPEESDLGALAMMCHFFALALVLEPLFPEIQGMHLGNMSLDSLEKVCQVIQARSAAAPHDTTLQTALSMLDFPMQVAHAYRATRRAVTSPAAPYRNSPQSAGYPTQSFTLPSPADVHRHPSYANASLQSPFNTYQTGYNMNTFQNTMPIRHDSSASRTQSDPRLSTGSSLQSMSSQPSSAEPANIDYFGGAQTYQQNTGYAQMHDYQNRLVQAPTPAQIWT
ncbi:hypothetical protein PMZ80_009467 [Knufia obscura]|uniref:Uncharacterized protein n=1 Tax=Knufia obscura TaxID=1635080 RepID=A0ABR0RCZ8_9EURO|nr:hypothetical protein PMZ80_009467 [Knufia obscura]